MKKIFSWPEMPAEAAASAAETLEAILEAALASGAVSEESFAPA
jgi:hypothetical protein